MRKTFCSFLIGVLLMAVAIPTAWGALGAVGNPIDPHGFPAFYQDGAGLALEPCLPPPAGNAALRPDLCIFGPLAGPPLQVGDESFWWMATADAPPLVNLGKSLLVLALEGAFAVGPPVDGQQIAFGRVRIRIDVAVPGTYIVTHPFGTITFPNVTVADGINYTADIGGANVINPALGYNGALGSAIGPFLTWPGYDTDPTLQGFAIDPLTGLPTTTVAEQYVGNPGIPHVVTGGTTGNAFRIQGPGGIDVQTDLFQVMGKVYDPTVVQTVHVFPNAPPANLFAVGPANRIGDVGPITPQQPEGIRTGQDYLNYPVGFPLYYQENAGTVAAPVGGAKLTLCPATDPMCISMPINPADPNSVALRTGDEGFFWSADARIQRDTIPTVPRGLDGLLVMGLEAAFGAAGNPVPGQQIVFARLRIRIDTPLAGTYTVTHPYGEEVFADVPIGNRAINFTRDIMIANPVDPDSAFVGALYGDAGPLFLTWPNYTDPLVPGNAVLQKSLNPADPLAPVIQYVGNPVTDHVVTGSPNNTNYFRIRGPGGIDVQTDLFSVSGKVFDPATFNLAAAPGAPVANPDAAALDVALAPSVTIDVLANDTFVAPATVTVLPPGGAFGPDSGNAVVNAGNTVTYTPIAGFAGVDTFAYQITDASGLTSVLAIVTVTVTPVETMAVNRAQLRLRRLQLDLQGTNSIEGAVLTIHAGPTAGGAALGQARVVNGRWRFRGTVTNNLTSISIVSSTGKTLLNQPVLAR